MVKWPKGSCWFTGIQCKCQCRERNLRSLQCRPQRVIKWCQAGSGEKSLLRLRMTFPKIKSLTTVHATSSTNSLEDDFIYDFDGRWFLSMIYSKSYHLRKMSKMPVSSGEFLENLPRKSLPIEIFCWAFTLTLSQLEFGRDDWSAVKGDAARSLCGGICGGAKNLGKTTKKRPKEKILQGRFPDIRNFRQKSFMNEILVEIPISWVEVLGFPPKGGRISREKTNPGCLFCPAHMKDQKRLEKTTPRDRAYMGILSILYTLCCFWGNALWQDYVF